MIYSESCQPRIWYHLSIINGKDFPRQTKTEKVHVLKGFLQIEMKRY